MSSSLGLWKYASPENGLLVMVLAESQTEVEQLIKSFAEKHGYSLDWLPKLSFKSLLLMKHASSAGRKFER